MAKLQAALPGMLRGAGILLVITGLLHCLGWIISGWNSDTRLLVPVGAVYIVLGLLLLIRQYWSRYLSFIIVLIGCVGAYIQFSSAQIADWQLKHFLPDLNHWGFPFAV